LGLGMRVEIGGRATARDNLWQNGPEGSRTFAGAQKPYGGRSVDRQGGACYKADLLQLAFFNLSAKVRLP